MSKLWEKDKMLLAWIEAFLNGKETFRGAMIQAWLAGASWKERLNPDGTEKKP